MKLILFTWIFFVIAYLLYADAYLSEDRIYYSSDSYHIDYDNEIIYANGHAFFRKESKTVNADRIIIYYSDDQKKAQLFNNVIVIDADKNTTVMGDYGEALYKEGLYIIEGNVVFTDEERTIKSEKIRTLEGEGTLFTGSVFYSDDEYDIEAPSLNIIDDTVTFESNVEALHRESGDTIYCESITYNSETGNMIFLEKVFYVQGEGEEGERAFLMRSNAVRYFKESDTFVLLGDVFVLDGEFTAQSSIARYFRDIGVLRVSGDVVLQEDEKYIYCNNANYDRNTKKTVLFNSVRGLLLEYHNSE